MSHFHRDPFESLLSHFFVSLNFSGFGGLWGYFRVTILGALQRQVDLEGVFVKTGDFIKFKGLLVEFLENRRS